MQWERAHVARLVHVCTVADEHGEDRVDASLAGRLQTRKAVVIQLVRVQMVL